MLQSKADKVSRDETIKTRETALAISEAKIVELREFITAKTGLIEELRGKTETWPVGWQP
jgi:hypothetical protein